MSGAGRPGHPNIDEEIANMATEGHDHDHDHDPSSPLARIEALKIEGVHRAGEHEGPFSLHVLGIGKTGVDIIAKLAKDPPGGFDGTAAGFSALAVDIGDTDLAAVRAAAGDRNRVQTVDLGVPPRDQLLTSLNRWREFLKMEYPRYYWNPNYEPWLPSDLEFPAAGERFPRALAKAIYGSEYYQHGEIEGALDEFASGILKSKATPLVAVVFGMGGGAGSGIVVEIARHLSSIKLGRRPWVVGVGVLPCSGDDAGTRDGALFPMINELDCMIDTEKNKGVMAVWGDLYKNPFTGGFFAVPQQEVYDKLGDLTATHDYVDQGITEFLARDGSVHLYESLKALNWLSVPGETWHPAIRGEQSENWVNLLTWRKPADVDTIGDLGLVKGVTSQYAEIRTFGSAGEAGPEVVERLAAAARTTVEPGVIHVDGGDPGINILLPRLTKLDLATFVPSRDVYDTLEWEEKLFKHSWLLDLGVMLCEPSIRFDGMGGECIWGCACWVVVPHAAIRGEKVPTTVGAAADGGRG
jgi:hypothetical protein